MKTDSNEIEFNDFHNPHTLFGLLRNPDLMKWLMDKHILASKMNCEKCKSAMSLHLYYAFTAIATKAHYY